MVPARILVVDDTSDVLTLVCRVLEGQGYQVLAASDGNAAMAACERVRGEIDLLLTDIRMPGMNGVELAGSLVAAYPEVRVLFISGQCEESEIPVLVSEKGFGFVPKPFLPHVLLDAVHGMLPSGRKPVQKAAQSGSMNDVLERIG